MAYYRKTVAEAFKILSDRKQEPRIVMGDFLDDFYGATKEERIRMVNDPLPEENEDPEIQKWLVFFVAAIDWLCFKYDIQTPDWIRYRQYVLKEPWFLYEGWRMRAWQLATTPTPFKMRNIFTGDKVLSRV